MHFDNPINLLIIGVLALLILGPKRLPEAARGLGRGIREFKEAVMGQRGDDREPGAKLPEGPTAETPPETASTGSQSGREQSGDPHEPSRAPTEPRS